MAAVLDRALLFLYAETPVHAGADTGLGALDLPIQREVTTGLPIIKGESLKGALREHLRPVLDEELWIRMFGGAPPRSGQSGGAISPGELRVHEAQLVAFPAPSLDGFAWITSPLARARLNRRAGLAQIASFPDSGSGDARDGGDDEADDTRCLMTDTKMRGTKNLPRTSQVLGSYAFTATGDPGLKNWAASLAGYALPDPGEHAYFRNKLQTDLYQVSNVAMTAITSECTVVTARVQLGAEDDDGNRTKTVAHGPFYSEYLPAETLLAALIESATPDHLTVLARQISNQVVQVGGDETIGKGLMWCRICRQDTDQETPALPADGAGR